MLVSAIKVLADLASAFDNPEFDKQDIMSNAYSLYQKGQISKAQYKAIFDALDDPKSMQANLDNISWLARKF